MYGSPGSYPLCKSPIEVDEELGIQALDALQIQFPKLEEYEPRGYSPRQNKKKKMTRFA